MGWAFCGGLRGRRDLFCLRRGTFPAQEKCPKRAKTKVLESFPANKRGIYRTMSNCRIDFRSAPLPLIVQNCRCIRLTFGTMWASPAIGETVPIFHTISGSGAGAENDSSFHAPCIARPNVWGSPQHPATCGARGGSPETIRFLAAFFHTFCRCWQKYVAKGIPIPIPKKLKSRRAEHSPAFFVSSSADPAGPLHCRRSPRGRGRAAGRA